MLWRSMVFFLIPLTLMVSGCLQVHTVIKIKPDGSGTIEETLIYAKHLALMNQVFGGDKESDRGEPGSVYSESKLKERAATFGDGVSYVSAKNIKSKDGRGYTAIYSFKNINGLRLNQNIGSIVPSGTKGPKMRDEHITFRFIEGTPATVVIQMPEEAQSRVTVRKKEATSNDEEGIETARLLLGDLRFSTKVEFQGQIVETNASFRKGSLVTLIDLDFDEMLGDEGFLRQAQSFEEISLEDVKSLMKKYPGVKVELKREVRVKFRK